MKKICIIILLTLPSYIAKGQQFDINNFNCFVDKFADFSFPLDPIQYFLYLTSYHRTKYISKVEYDKYLRTRDDSFWKFNDNYEYCFGGKKKFENYWLIFYRRSYTPEDFDKSIGETILETMTFGGKLISRIAVGGGYEDTLNLKSMIYSPEKIEINYTKYTDKKMISNTNTYETKEIKYIKHYYIQKDGKIVLKQ